MYYRQKFDTFIRNYDGAGYITNTGNFSDRVVNGSGTVFLTALSREPQTLDTLVRKASDIFIDVKPQDIIEDAKEFYDELFEDGFLTRGNTIEELLCFLSSGKVKLFRFSSTLDRSPSL